MKKILSKIKLLLHGWIIKLTIITKVDPLVIDNDEYVFVVIKSDVDISEIIRLSAVFRKYVEKSDKFLLISEREYDRLSTIKISKNDVIVSSVDRNIYFYLKSAEYIENASDEIKKMFLSAGIENPVITQPKGITYNVIERKLLIEKLSNVQNG